MDRGYFAGAFPRRWASITGVLAGIAGGMQYVHSKRILHGDLNPSNILLKVPSFVELLRPCVGLKRNPNTGTLFTQSHNLTVLGPAYQPKVAVHAIKESVLTL